MCIRLTEGRRHKLRRATGRRARPGGDRNRVTRVERRRQLENALSRLCTGVSGSCCDCSGSGGDTQAGNVLSLSGRATGHAGVTGLSTRMRR